MDARVDDFLNEIDGMIPNKHKEIPKSSTTNACDWEECFDDTSGFSYYWNVSTNEVTWEVPLDYKKWKAQQKKPKPPKTTEKTPIYKPETLFPVVPISQIPDTIIYKIGEVLPNKIDKKNAAEKLDIVKSKIEATRKLTEANKKVKDKRKRQKSPDSEDEKITLISSYGGDTDSDDDFEENSTKSTVTLTTKDVRNKDSSSTTPLTDQQPKVTGIALLASYGESDDEDDTKNIFTKDKHTQSLEKIPQSTLFPIKQIIDASQFDISQSSKHTSKALLTSSSTDDQKIYQRKRRIGLELPVKKTLETSSNSDDSRTGFGFNSIPVDKYVNFKSAGHMSFVKSDVDSLVTDGLENADVLKEKLLFLCEGKNGEISPVQIMLIQLETLQTARLAGCLQKTYLIKWLQETTEEISKLEKDTTPDGWQLEWDSGEKRYSYRHLHTGHTQWDYPTGTSHAHENPPDTPLEDMDISTTPPPPNLTTLATPTVKESDATEDITTVNEGGSDNDDSVAIQRQIAPQGVVVVEEIIIVPAPPKIGRVVQPVAPPPPILTEGDILIVPPLPLLPEELPPPPPPPPEEPLPLGVENTRQNTKDGLNTVLDSFYSDIAAIESSIVINNIPEDVAKVETSPIINAADVIPVEVKKRKKLKMSQGLSMKKKGVSKLVEKWKNVQKNLD